jgi:uncharacterized protein (DUF1015 family)
MPRFAPFRGLLFDARRVGSLDSVTAPPYDMVDERTRRRLEERSAHNVVRLDLGQPSPEEGPARYEHAAELLDRWRRDGTLRRVPRPAFFPYEMRFPSETGSGRIRGLICLVELEPLGTRIVPHERTMRAPVQDRLRLMRALRANLSPVYAVFPGPNHALAARLDSAGTRAPLALVTDEDGVEHRLWSVEESMADLPDRDPLLIADGHHRTATALRYQQERRAVAGAGPWDQLMMLLVDAELQRPPVLPYHRVVVRGSVPTQGERVASLQGLLSRVDDEAMTCGIVARRGSNLEYVVTRLSGDPPVVRAVHDQLLQRAETLRYTPDAETAERDVALGGAEAAIVLPATSARRIREVIDDGERLPEKSTFFWPKPRTGMVLRVLEPD